MCHGDQEAWLLDITKCIEGKSSAIGRDFFREKTTKPNTITIENNTEDSLLSDWVDLGDLIQTEKKEPKEVNMRGMKLHLYGDITKFSEGRLLDLFCQYKRRITVSEIYSEDDGDDEEQMDANGMTRFFQDVGVDPEDVSWLIYAWHLKAKVMGIFTKTEFITGMKKLQLDTIQKVKTALHNFKIQLHKDKTLFKEIYKFAFTFSLENNSKVISIDVAVLLVDMLMDDRYPHAMKWKEFLSSQKERKSVNIDTWNMFLLFSESIDTNFSNFSGGGEWPILLEDYVDWSRNK